VFTVQFRSERPAFFSFPRACASGFLAETNAESESLNNAPKQLIVLLWRGVNVDGNVKSTVVTGTNATIQCHCLLFDTTIFPFYCPKLVVCGNALARSMTKIFAHIIGTISVGT